MKITEFATKKEELEYIMKLNSKLPMNNFLDLLEQHHLADKKFLFENVNPVKLAYLKRIQMLGDKNPKINKLYIPISVWLINDTLRLMDTEGNFPPRNPAKFRKLIQITNKELEYEIDGDKTLKWPYDYLRPLSYYATILSSSAEQYDEIRAMFGIYFDQEGDLPEFQ